MSAMDRMLAIAALPREAIPQSARRFAVFSLFDWMVVARAGADQPLSRIIRAFIENEGGRPVATVIGGAGKVPARAAALANGTISHALDYDDTHFAHVGHPSVAIIPAALAVAEEMDSSAAEIRDAFLLGAEASIRIGMVLGRAHYQRGFHQTATAGAFGATVAAGRLRGLSPGEMRSALSLVGTRASGLKSQFGTMGKPFNAGIAASNGVEAAGLAKRGFASCDDGIAGLQGFIETHSDAPDRESPWASLPPGTFLFEDVQYKLHACCHGTHAMIEALLEARRRHGFDPKQVRGIEIAVNPRWLSVCDIKEPRTGLEAKFSFCLLAAMVLHGLDTSFEKTYGDAVCADEVLQVLACRVTVTGEDAVSDTATRVAITLHGGARLEAAHELGQPLPDARLERGLRAKAKGLLGEVAAAALWSAIADLDGLSARDLARLLQG